MLHKPFAARFVLPVAAVELLLELAFANRYGYHRDELYFRTAARHRAFGYDDQGPVTPLLGWLSEAIFGESPRGLRVVSRSPLRSSWCSSHSSLESSALARVVS